jgi:BMFP domain-containing protein YqiC
MVNKSKILSDLSKMAVDAMGTFSGVKKEVETIVGLRVNKIINKMNLVRRDEFEVLKKLVQKLIIENQDIKQKKSSPIKRSHKFKKKKKKVVKKKGLK